MTICPLNKDEFRRWTKLIKKQIYPVDRNYLKKAIISTIYDYDMVVMKDGKIIVSYLSYKILDNYLIIYFMYTLPSYRNKNCITSLIEHTLLNTTEFVGRIFARADTIQSVGFFKSKGYMFLGQDKLGKVLYERDLFEIVQPRRSEQFVIEGSQNKELKLLLKEEPFNCDIYPLRKYHITL